MSDTVKLLFGVHAHQPAGNFPEVIRDAHERCYRPFLDVVERYPNFRFAMHISGWLMDFLHREYPEDMARLRAMVARGQTEMFGGGDTEPVLAAIPDLDRRSQIQALSDRIHKHFRVRPRGAWLTERVWEATVVPALAGGQIQYAVVDDYHFLCAGQPTELLDGYFCTEEDGARLDLMPISETLRYKFPFAPAEDAVGYLEAMKPGAAAIYFDDIEKFGIWPETHEWVYGRRWLESFIEAVLRSTKIHSMSYFDYHAANRSRGIVYLPTVSYVEMNDWTLPPQNARRFAQLVERAKHEGTFGQDRAFLRGGHWRNFFSRYPESNWMHKRMELVSRRFHALPAKKQKAKMGADLHLAQANDAYWHGLFGGIYLPHLRRQVYSAIARLERAIDAVRPRPSVERFDLDYDDQHEIFLSRPELFVAVKPQHGASVCELTHYGLAHNFADTLARREEHYFDKIRGGGTQARQPETAEGPAGIASIHDRVAFRAQISDADLEPDRYPRTMFLDFWEPVAGARELVTYEALPSKANATARFSTRRDGVVFAKRIQCGTTGVNVTYDLAAGERVAGRFAVELNVALPSCDGPGGSYFVESEATGDLGATFDAADCTLMALEDRELGGSVLLAFAPRAAVHASPHYTVSQSEAGFEKIWQAATIRSVWAVELQPGKPQRLTIRLRIKQIRA